MAASPALRGRQNPAYRSSFPFFSAALRRRPFRTTEIPVQHRLTILALLTFCALARHAYGSSDSAVVYDIVIHGNNKTRERTVLAYMNVDTGAICDSTLLVKAQYNLLAGNLFSSVRIFPVPVPKGVRLHVIVAEKNYFSLSEYSGGFVYWKYNNPGRWVSARLGVAHSNFRGRNERLTVTADLLYGWGIAVRWTKPFAGTPYFVGVGTSIARTPSQIERKDRVRVSQSSMFGRRIGDHSRIYVQATPTYNVQVFGAEKGTLYLDTVFVDSLLEGNPWTNLPQNKGRTWTDTMRVADTDSFEVRRWDGLDYPYYELFAALGWTTDRRNARFSPRKGYYFSVELLTNALYHRGRPAYGQASTDFRFYHRGIFRGNTVAYRTRPTLRVGKGGRNHRLYMGGESTLRGFTDYHFGRTFMADNRLLFSWEYRFPIFKTPEVEMPRLGKLHKGLQRFHYRFDGALILDAGHLWPHLAHPKTDAVTGVGAGLGLRMMLPTLARSLVFDVVLPVSSARCWPPSWHLYIDAYF